MDGILSSRHKANTIMDAVWQTNGAGSGLPQTRQHTTAEIDTATITPAYIILPLQLPYVSGARNIIAVDILNAAVSAGNTISRRQKIHAGSQMTTFRIERKRSSRKKDE